ncbi:copper chaperone PCu(A)C [Pusillimonas caeni]|uniref:copper chaperone PCu(A)C n=1 Tax=Pusillimonas caeni TaxID=1348472 RepID=UPI000E5A0A17|nr:copper chaperone PCu(A)C [Pusillimonas caeni]TFL15177.1 copper chaperone PCu(A)C [Pusillimonas caeni]
MKHAFAVGLALFGAVAAGPSFAHAHGDHQGHAQGDHAAHAHAGHGAQAMPSPDAMAAMPVSASVAVSDCWIRLLPSPAPSAGYFIAANKGAETATLAGAASASYGHVMLHQTTHTDGMSRMSHVQGVEIPAGQKLEFKPGGYHIMLEKPSGEIKVGDTVPMQFLLASGEKAQADCEVKPANTLAK